LFQKFPGGGRSAASGAAAEFGETLSRPCMGRRLLVANQDFPEESPVFRLGGTAIFGCPNTEAAHDVVIEIPNRERRHG
jgi:hypothetical protein